MDFGVSGFLQSLGHRLSYGWASQANPAEIHRKTAGFQEYHSCPSSRSSRSLGMHTLETDGRVDRVTFSKCENYLVWQH